MLAKCKEWCWLTGLKHDIDLYGVAPTLIMVLTKTINRHHKRPFDVTDDLKRQQKSTFV